MGPCAVLTLLTPKKMKVGACMCMDSQAVNKITIYCRFIIPRFEICWIDWEARACFRRLTSGVDTIKSALGREMNGRRLS